MARRFECRTRGCDYGPGGPYYLREDQCKIDKENYLRCPSCSSYVNEYRPVNRNRMATRGVVGATGGALVGLAVGGPVGALFGTILGGLAGSAAGAVEE